MWVSFSRYNQKHNGCKFLARILEDLLARSFANPYFGADCICRPFDVFDRDDSGGFGSVASAGHLPLVELLVTNGAKNLSVALFLAIQQQKVPVAKLLLEHGANPNIHYTADNGPTPLHLAAGQGNVEEARLLLEHGADVNGLEQNGSTPLVYAVSGTSKELVELLFANGAVVPERPGYWTILQHWALGAGDTNIATLLLAHGAKVNAEDAKGTLHYISRLNKERFKPLNGC